jgi:phytoene synthase
LSLPSPAAILEPPAERRSPQEIVRRSRSSFAAAFGALDRERRHGLIAIYAFCRVIDDAADQGGDLGARRNELDRWQHELELAEHGTPRTPVALELQRAFRRFGVEPRHLHNVLDGVRSDLDHVSFDTSAELESYCFKVASSVGLACMPLFGAKGERAERYARHLGQALQHTNILRDLRADAAAGRVYVPGELLQQLEVDSQWLSGRGPDLVYRHDGPMAALTGALSSRAAAHFECAGACLDPTLRRRLLAPEIMGAIYRDLLQRLERHGGELCRQAQRVRVPRWRKLWLAAATRWRLGNAV